MSSPPIHRDRIPLDEGLLCEGVRVPLPPAGPARRILARLVDGFVQVLLAGAVLGGVGTAVQNLEPATRAMTSARVGAILLAALAILATTWLYLVAFEALWKGSTPGKHLLGIAVVLADGRPPDLPAVVIRNLLRALDLLPAFGLVGLVAVVTDPLHRRVGDRVAGTRVVNLEPFARVRGDPEIRRWPLRGRSDPRAPEPRPPNAPA